MSRWLYPAEPVIIPTLGRYLCLTLTPLPHNHIPLKGVAPLQKVITHLADHTTSSTFWAGRQFPPQILTRATQVKQGETMSNFHPHLPVTLGRWGLEVSVDTSMSVLRNEGKGRCF